jgi:hypothetical protein
VSTSALLRRLFTEANPVLLKDLRQYLRGRLFRFAFIFTLVVVTTAASLVLSQINDRNRNSAGPKVFFAVHLIYVLAMFLVGPVLANRNMAAEREQLHLDALALTGLSPARIVAGKFFSAAGLSMLVGSAFLPVFAICYMLFGLDLVGATSALALTTLGGLGLNMLGIWAACLARTTLAANLLLAGLLIVLTGICTLWITFTRFAMFNANISAWVWLANLLFVGLTICTGIFWLYGLAAWLIAHEAQSSAPRVRAAALLVVAVTLGWVVTHTLSVKSPDSVNIFGSCLYALATLLMLPSLCEPDAIGRRAALDLPRRGRTRLGFLFLAGGGSATLLWLLTLGVISLLFLLPTAPAADFSMQPTLPFAMLCLCVAVGTWLPGFAGRPNAPRGWLLFCSYGALPAAALLHIILGALFGALGDSGYDSLNPFLLLGLAGSGKDYQVGLSLWFLIAAIGLARVSRRIALAHEQKSRAINAGHNAPRETAAQ